MRSHWLALMTLAFIATGSPAQQPPAQLAPAQPDRLDFYLRRWEGEMKTVKTFIAECDRTEKEYGSNVIDEFIGTAKYVQPDRALLEMQKKGKPDRFEKYLCTGTHVYTFVPREKKIYAYPLPKPKQGQVADDNVLSLIFSIKAEEARRRYDIRLAKTSSGTLGEDNYYVYIEIQPRTPADKADFSRARLVLNKDSFMPRELWFQQPSGMEVRWNIKKFQINVPVNIKEFSKPDVPPGWKMELSPEQNTVQPPRVIRQQER